MGIQNQGVLHQVPTQQPGFNKGATAAASTNACACLDIAVAWELCITGALPFVASKVIPVLLPEAWDLDACRSLFDPLFGTLVSIRKGCRFRDKIGGPQEQHP